MVFVRLLAITVALAVPQAAPADPPHWQVAGCEHGHGFNAAIRGIDSVMRSPLPLTRQRGARAWHFAACTMTRAQARTAHWRLLELRAWRRSYKGFWWIHQQRIPPYLKATLARLRGCESGGDYQQDGHHKGAYQYLYSTWARAQAGWPMRYRTAAPQWSSPAHQDAVTARFFPAHRGEWACKA